MGIVLSDIDLADTLNDVEREYGSFNDRLIEIAVARCMAFLPDSFFNENVESNKDELTEYISEYYGIVE